MRQPFITYEQIRRYAAPEIIGRGEEYVRQGAVHALRRQDDTLQASVEGSDFEPYHVTLSLDLDGEYEADCTCPYDWGGWCKHIVAVALAYLRDPQATEERPGLDVLLASLEAEELRALIRTLAERNPDLTVEIEAQIALQQTKAAPGRPAAGFAPIDPLPIRQQIQLLFRGRDRMRHYEAVRQAGDIIRQLQPLVQAARDRMEAGDGRNAITLLNAITEECLESFFYDDNYNGDVSNFYASLGPVWTEAILCADLSPAERKAWVRQISGWLTEIENFYCDGITLEPAILAAEKGWDDPYLVRVLEGTLTDREAKRVKPPAAGRADANDTGDSEAEDQEEDREDWDGGDEDIEWEDAEEVLTITRLNVLERQGRFQEALRLAEVEGQPTHAAVLLVRLGQIEEAVDYGLRSLTHIEQAFTLARALREHQAHAEALQIAERSLSLEGYSSVEPGRWLRDYAASQGQTDLALRAGQIAFKEAPELEDYKQLQVIAGNHWPKLQTDLLTQLAGFTSGYSVPGGVVEIFLYEGLIAQALAVVQKTHSRELMIRVVEAAAPAYPDEAIALCQQQAAPIMDGGQAAIYDVAADWVARAKAIYLATGRKEAWQGYLATLLQKYRPKYKLMGLLKPLASD